MLEVMVSDPALIHGAIMLAATHWTTIGGLWSEIAASFYYHKVETIKLLRERVTVQHEAPSESTIAATAILILVEVRYPQASRTQLYWIAMYDINQNSD